MGLTLFTFMQHYSLFKSHAVNWHDHLKNRARYQGADIPEKVLPPELNLSWDSASQSEEETAHVR